MPRHSFKDEIKRLDPERDHLRICYLDTYYEFPFDMARAEELALFRSFAVPSISGLLDRTGEFAKRPQKRYDDTDLILNEILQNGYDSERGRAAIRRMNHLHGRYAISNDEFLYIMSTFIFVPIDWNARFGWRKALRNEKLAGYYYWRNLGRYMNIKNIPDTYQEFRQFNRDYERTHFHYAASNRRVADITIDLFLSWFLPQPLRALGRPAMYAVMDDPLLDAIGFPRPSRFMRRLVETELKTRARIVRLLPQRTRPRLRTAIKHRSYPHGYTIEDLGPGDPAQGGPHAARR